MQKIKFIKSIFAIFLFISILCLNIMFFSTDVFASTNLNELDNINNSIDEAQNYGTEDVSNIFNNKTIKVCEYIYNLDDSADYIYIEFNEGGYVMLVANSFEIMEYSLQGNLPYTNFENKNYYLGPSNYFRKETDNYINLLTEDSIVLAEDKITEYSRNIRNILKINYNENISAYEIFNSISNFDDGESLDLSSPNIDTNNLIIPTLGTGTLIPNYQYFSVNPIHGNNYVGGTYGNGNSGTCASVAAQIFLGYNNYYNDRRIIEDRYLNGYDDSTNSIKYPERNPNHCTDPNSMTRYTIGTRSEDTGENSFYSKVITTIMEPNTSGASLDETYEGIIEILNEKLSANDYTIDYELKGWFFGYSPVDSSKIKSEINAGRPVIISLSSNLGAIDHQVVGYGYQNYTYPGSSDTYEGYIVHFGWTGNNCVWVNSSWCKGYISLQMNHTHNYNIVTDNIINNSTIEIRCEECGHRTLDDLFVLSSNTIIDTKYDLIGKITIPSNINGIEVRGIGSETFKNCRSLQEITISNTVTNIDSSAFENCSYLQSVTLPSSLVAIGSSAFKGCGSLANITIPNGVTNIDSSAFENCSYLQSVTLSTNLVAIGISAFKGCGSLGSITILSSVQYIDDSAFENCGSLVSVVVEREISDITNLGNYAFAGCSSLLQITVPKNRVAEYKNKVYWSSYKNRIIANDDNFSEIELNCLSDFYKLTPLSVNYNKIYKLNVLCGKSYQIIADSNSNVKINLYDCNMNLISSNINSLITYLGVNTYYMDMELVNESSAEIVTTTFELRWKHDGERIYYNDKHNLLTHLHQISNDTYFTKLYYINNNGAGLYKLQISGNTQNGLILPTELGIIGIYNDSDRTINQLLNKYPNSNEYAITNVGQDTMYVYLPRNGYFYIDVLMPSDNYESLDLTISSVESETINLLSSMTSTFTEDLTVDNNLEEYAKKLIIKQTSKYLITLNSSDALSNNFNIIMFKQTYNSSSNSYYTNFELIEFITNTSTQKTFEISLNDGVYFIYYYGNDTNVNIDLTLTRVLQSNNDRAYAMQADPVGSGYSVGSEVRFNNGIRNNYTITEGFTRNLFFVLEDFYTYSRLDFDWYSSNVNVATVSDFGTVYAKNVSSTQSVTIYAVYKEDPSLIYYRTFTVVDDTAEEEIVIICNMSYSYSEENGTYQIELNDMNSPYPWIQYYTWSVYVPYQETDITCSMNMWGEITASGPGFATLTGTYTMNPRVTIIINLSIIE